MPCTTTIQLDNTKQLNRYHRQYLKNYKTLNMEFVEWISSKLNTTEQEAVTMIKEWKNNLLITIK